jgi:hypothetical protein
VHTEQDELLLERRCQTAIVSTACALTLFTGITESLLFSSSFEFVFVISDERAHNSQSSRYLLGGLDVEVVVALTNLQNCEAQLPEVKKYHHEQTQNH